MAIKLTIKHAIAIAGILIFLNYLTSCGSLPPRNANTFSFNSQECNGIRWKASTSEFQKIFSDSKERLNKNVVSFERRETIFGYPVTARYNFPSDDNGTFRFTNVQYIAYDIKTHNKIHNAIVRKYGTTSDGNSSWTFDRVTLLVTVPALKAVVIYYE